MQWKPVIRGKSMKVQTILEYLKAGDSWEEILNQNPPWKKMIFGSVFNY